jgi:hypothetical protein
MINTMTLNRMQTASAFGMPISGHQCVLGTDRITVPVRDRALTGAVKGLPVYAVLGAFPGPDAWSPPI